MIEKKFPKVPETIEGTKEHLEMVDTLEKSREQSLKEIQIIVEHLEDAKEIVRKSGYMNEKEMEEFFHASDMVVERTRDIVNLCMKDIAKYNTLVEEYEMYGQIGAYWDKEYDRREAKVKITGVKSNAIH